jgi:RHS repeat-associated protein
MKRIFLTWMAMFAAIAAVEAQQINLNEGLVAYYPFNGNANDESGNGNHGTIIGDLNLTSGRTNDINGAYEFSGTNSNYIYVSDNASLNMDVFTISAWVNIPIPQNEGGYIVNKGRDITNGSYRLNTHGIGAQTLYDGVNDATFLDMIPSNQWVLLTGTVNGDIAKSYINGQLIDTKTLSNSFTCNSSGEPLTIGAHYYSGVPSYWIYPLKGKIDEVRIYNRALNDSEIQSLYDGEIPVACDLTTLPTTNVFYDATADLCARTVLSGSDENGSVDVEQPLRRSHLAKIAFRGLYLLNGDAVPSTLPSDSYPSIYPDLNVETLQNKYYYRPAKALLYLEYGDGRSPFDRNRTNFLPDENIARSDVLKVLLETFHIEPDLDNTSSPFPSDTDVDALRVNDPFKTGYIRKALQLGIIDAATTFRPFDDCLRGEAFMMLYRIMQKVEAGLIADPAPDFASYYEPSNITLQTVAMGLGLSLGNFNHYTKTSFAISGVAPLSFSHTYNSYTTELPDEFYGIHDLGQGKIATYRPLGYGWSHEYHSFVTLIEDRMILHWGGGTIHVYKSDGVQFVPESIGVYDEVSFEGSTLLVKSKSQVEYRFKKQTPSGTGANILQLYSIKDRNGNEVLINYTDGVDGMMVISSVSGAGRELTFTYKNNTNLIAQVADPLNRTVRFDYTFNATLNDYLLTSFTDAKGQTTLYEYSNPDNQATCRLLNRIQLPKGNYIENEYDANRRLSKSTTGINGVPTTQTAVSVNANWRDKTLNSTVQQDRGGVTSSVAYTFNMQNSVTALDGDENLHVAASYGNSDLPELPTDIQANNMNINDIQYDAKGNVLRMEETALDGSGVHTIAMSYNEQNDMTAYTDARGNTTYYDYDDAGNLIKVRAPENAETSLEHNSKGLVTATVNPEGIRTEMDYDTYGNPTEIRIPALNNISTKSEYDAASRLTAVTDFLNRKSAYSYDANDNLLSEVNAANHTTSYAYDANDNLTSITNAKGGVTSMIYDNATDWLTSVSFAGATKQFTYNADGTLQTFTKPDGTAISSTYDALGRVISDGVNQYTYDANHRTETVTKDGRTLTFGYDGFGRTNSVQYSDFSGNTVGYAYDDNGNIIAVTYPDGKSVTYAYDNLNRLTSVTDWNGRVISYSYLKDSRPQSATYPNGMTVNYTYDNAGRQTGKTVKRSDNTIIASYNFILNDVGNIISETREEPYDKMILPGSEVNYTYNSANLIQTAGNVSFAFDANGNTTSRGDANYSYDLSDKLTSGGGFNFEYDGLGNIRSNGSKRYLIDVTGMGNVLAETDMSGNPTAYYLYGQGLEACILPDGTTKYYVSDYRGSVVAMVDASASANITHKYQYDDFGNLTQKEESDANPFRYVGKYGVMYANDNLYYMRARFYDPTIGRFLSEDPIWSTNLYPYADNNPVMGVDPMGESVLAGAVIGGSTAAIMAIPDVVTSFLDVGKGFKYMIKGDYASANYYMEIANDKVVKANKSIVSGAVSGASTVAKYAIAGYKTLKEGNEEYERSIKLGLSKQESINNASKSAIVNGALNFMPSVLKIDKSNIVYSIIGETFNKFIKEGSKGMANDMILNK